MKRIFMAGLVGAICLFAASCGGNSSKAQAMDSEEAAEATDSEAEEVQAQEPKAFDLYSSDFIVKYNKYAWDVAQDFSSATRNEDGDGTWEITKKGDTMTVVESYLLPGVGRQTVTTVMHEVDGNVEITKTTQYANEKYDKLLDAGGNRVKTRVAQGYTLADQASSWFGSEGHGQKGVFISGSRNPQYADENMEATVSNGEKMFGRATKEYKYKVKKGSLLDLGGYEISKREIYDAERTGTDYIRYKAWLALKDGEEKLSYEVTEFEILN